MERKELRLGNWVEFNDYLIKVGFTRLNEHLMKCVFFDENWINYFTSPIPLTEEILLKCGFEKNEIGGYIIYTELGSMLCIYKDGSVKWNDRYIDINIKHLHQLQNLYFALTNQELEVELWKN